MSGLFKQFETNTAKEVDGVDVAFHEAINDDGSVPTFTLARMGKSNKAYSKALEAATRPYRRQVELGTLKAEVAEELFLDVFVSTILKGWHNILAKDGTEMQFNKQNARSLLKALPEVYERLQEEAKMAANFRDAGLEEEAKN